MFNFPNYYKNNHYFNRYCKFITFCKTQPRDPAVDYDTHHVVPKSFNGTNDPINLIALTYRQHFIAHLLLAKAFPYTNISVAIFYFIYGSKSNIVIKSSRAFEFARKLAGIAGSSWFNDGINNYRLPRSVAIQLGYVKGRYSTDSWKNKSCVNNGSKNFVISTTELKNYLTNGYIKGQLKQHKIIAITNGDVNTSIPEDTVSAFLKNNHRWYLGHTIKSIYRKKDNCVRMSIDEVEKNIPKDKVELYLQLGWIIGRSHKSKKSCANASIQIYLDNKNKRVNKHELQAYLDNGWKIGIPESRKNANRAATLNKITVYNSISGKERKVNNSDLAQFLQTGWIKGRSPSTIEKISAARKQGTI
jgi:hypothetical protein